MSNHSVSGGQKIFSSRGELLAVVFSGIAAVGAMIAGFSSIGQGYLVRESLRTPYSANLQSREIDSCAEFLFRAHEFRDGLTIWSSLARGDFSAEGTDIGAMLNLAEEESINFGSVFEKLSLLEGPKITDPLKSIDSARTSFVFEEQGKKPWSKESEKPWLKQFDHAVEAIKSRCRETMVGHNAGLL